jgi:hypothetical protein
MNQALFHTTNLKAAVALATMGFEPNTPPVTRIVREDGKESVVFWFNDQASNGLSAADVYRGMTKDGDVLNTKDPENPINYLRAYAANRDVYVDLIRNAEPFVELLSNGRRVMIRRDASEEDKAKIAKRLR